MTMEMETTEPKLFGVYVQYGSHEPEWRIFPVPPQTGSCVPTLIVENIKQRNYSKSLVKRKIN